MQTSPPYVGPVSFQPKDEDRFFGREQEAADLVSLVAAYPATLLYATSGAGKTSMLNAKLLPAFNARGATVFGPVRVTGPAETLRGRNPENVFAFFVLSCIAPRGVDPGSSLVEFLRPPPPSADADSFRPLRVLILDQFEELFTVFPEHWEHRRAFCEQIGEALENDIRLRVLFSMREELTAKLDAYSSELPDGLRMRLRLERLGPEAALEAITRPLEGTGVAYAPGVADALVEELRRNGPIRTEFIEPLHLQIVCSRLWQERPEGTVLIDRPVPFSGVGRALGDYYDRCVQEIARAEGMQEGVLRIGFERAFITPDGNRAPVRLLKGRTAGDLDGKYIPAFEKRYLIRQTFISDDASWYELSHDRFIVPIVESNKEWRTRDPSHVLYARIESQALDWKNTEGAVRSKLLLSKRDLDVATEWIEDEKQTGYGPSETARRLIEKSADARRKTKRLVLLGSIVLVLVLVIVAWTWALNVRENDRLKGASAEQARLAQSMLNQAMVHDALSLAILSVSKGPGVDVPEAAKQALVDAVGAAMQGAWLPRRAENIRAVAFAPNGNRVMTLTPRELCVWMAIDGVEDGCVEPPDIDASWQDAGFSPHGNFVWALASADTTTEATAPVEFTLWRIPKIRASFRRALTSSVRAISHDDKYLALGQHSLLLHRTDSNLTYRNPAITDPRALAFTHDGRHLLVAHDGRIDVLTVPELKLTRSIGIGDVVSHIEISHDDRHAALKVHPFKHLLLLDLRRGRVLKTADISPESQVIFVSDGKTLALVGPRAIRYLRIADGKTVRETQVSDRGKSFVRGNGVIKRVQQKADRGTDTVLEIYTLGASMSPKTKLLPALVVDNVDLSPNGARLVTSSGSLARVWDVDGVAIPLDSFSLARLKQLGCDKLQQLGGATMPEVSRACKSR